MRCICMALVVLKVAWRLKFVGKVDFLQPVGPETTGTLVGAHGLVAACDVRPRPLVPKSKELDARLYLDAMRKYGDGVVVYVVTDAVGAFLRDVLPHVQLSFVLVSGSSDHSLADVLPRASFEALADDGRLHRWYVQNAAWTHPKVVPMPIGVDLHTLAVQAWPGWGPKAPASVQEQRLLAARARAPAFAARSARVHAGAFSLYGHHRRLGIQLKLLGQPHVVDAGVGWWAWQWRWAKSVLLADVLWWTPMFPLKDTFWSEWRPELLRLLRSHPWRLGLVGATFASREDFWASASRFRFVACPPGQGLDTHRAWEVLVLGSIPVVQAGTHADIFGMLGLPAVQLQDHEWAALDSLVVQERLRVAELQARSLGAVLPEALRLRYWRARFRDAAPPLPPLPGPPLAAQAPLELTAAPAA